MGQTLTIAWRAVCFYAACVRWAAAGTLDRANAWGWLVGIPIIAILGWYFGFGMLTIPDEVQRFVAFTVLALFLTWIVLFVIRLIGAPGKLYGEAQDRIRVLTEQMVPKIRVHLDNRGDGVQIVKTRLKTDPNKWGPLSKWVQITVEGSTNAPLLNCQAHLTKIQRVNDEGSFEDLLFEQVFCNWSQAVGEEQKRIRIPALVKQAANLFSLEDVPTPILNLEVSHTKYQLQEEMQKPGRYKIEVVVSADGATSVREEFLLDWGGSFANIKFRQLPDGNKASRTNPPKRSGNYPSMLSFHSIWNCMKAINANQWLTIGTWVLALGTIGILLDAKFASERSLRAYVYAAPYRAFHIDDLGGVVQVYTIIGSKGSTFAQKVERRVGINLLPGPVPKTFEDLGPLKREEGVLVLAPGAVGFVIQNFRALTADELAKVMTPKGDLRVYAFGKITYEDAFGWPHQTTFCHAYFGPERLPFNGGFAFEHWQAKSCDRHNSAD